MKRRDSTMRKAVAAAIMAVALLFVLQGRRAHTYRKVIYDFQGIQDARTQQERDSLRADIERKVGRANTPWCQLQRAPRYRHFWDEYNTYGIIELNQLTNGTEE